MKLKVKEPGVPTIRLVLPNRLILRIIRKSVPELESLDCEKVYRLLRRYRGMELIRVHDSDGSEVVIKL